MSVYIVADIDIRDAATYETYKQGVQATVDKYGGRFLVRGGAATTVEGKWSPKRLIVIEFPDMARLEAWYASPDYKPLLDIRLGASTGSLIKVQGV